jgi:ferredoxin
MAYKINEDCISCGACEPECPNAAIKEGGIVFVIDPARCTECVGSHAASRCAEVCPVNAPQPDPTQVETKEQLLAKWRSLHPGQTPKL